MFRYLRSGSCLALALLAVTVSAAAQTPSPAGQPQPASPPQGPMIVEPIQHRFIVVPDVRLSEVNDRSATLVGGYGGMVMDDHLLVGGGGYWLANNTRDREMFYLGAVVGWYVFGKGSLDVNVMALVGGGQGTAALNFDGPVILRPDDIRFGHRPGHGSGYGPEMIWPGPFVVRQDFFVAEPMASVVWRFARQVGITGSVGYRLIAGAGGMNDEFRGVSGSVGIVFGGGK